VAVPRMSCVIPEHRGAPRSIFDVRALTAGPAQKLGRFLSRLLLYSVCSNGRVRYRPMCVSSGHPQLLMLRSAFSATLEDRAELTTLFTTPTAAFIHTCGEFAQERRDWKRSWTGSLALCRESQASQPAMTSQPMAPPVEVIEAIPC
jgi:hypothetical protein